MESGMLDRLEKVSNDALRFEREARKTIAEVRKFLNEIGDDTGGNTAHDNGTHNLTQNLLSQVAYNSSQSSSDQANSNVGGTTTTSSLDMPRGSVDKSTSSVGNISKALSARYPITKQSNRFTSTPRYPLKNTK